MTTDFGVDDTHNGNRPIFAAENVISVTKTHKIYLIDIDSDAEAYVDVGFEWTTHATSNLAIWHVLLFVCLSAFEREFRICVRRLQRDIFPDPRRE